MVTWSKWNTHVSAGWKIWNFSCPLHHLLLPPSRLGSDRSCSSLGHRSPILGVLAIWLTLMNFSKQMAKWQVNEPLVRENSIPERRNWLIAKICWVPRGLIKTGMIWGGKQNWGIFTGMIAINSCNLLVVIWVLDDRLTSVGIIWPKFCTLNFGDFLFFPFFFFKWCVPHVRNGILRESVIA